MSNENFLSVKNLTVEYTSAGSIIHAVNNVSFDMKQGETLALVGETGAGKTTIAKSILRILPDPPARIVGGEIFLKGEDLLKKPEADMLRVRGKQIAMIFQDPMTALNPVITVGKQVEEGLLLHNDYSSDVAREKAREMFDLVGISRRRYNDYPFEFSGGMKQRVVIAMALACSPELLLADEPTTALDVTIQAQILELMENLKKQYGASMILITHDLGVVAQHCDSVAIVYAGRIIEYGSKYEIFINRTHPYTKGLFNSLPDMNKDADRLKPILGSMPDPTNLPEGCAFHPRCPFATDACKSGEIPLVEISSEHKCRCCRIGEV
ncbi:MAG: ABC transporter ATP-binding protein [Lachnospiraceae bacterium]|jgi:oligopeptide/dipeptide ABC transporter ATP-binding protein